MRAEAFSGNSGFIETLSDVKVVRPLDRRFGYFRKDGQWRKSDVVTIGKTQYVVLNVLPEGDHEYIGIEYAARPDLLPQRLKGSPVPGDNAKVSALSIVPGLLPESTPPPPVAARNTADDRLTGVAMARSDENVVVVRSTNRGLLRTTDGACLPGSKNGRCIAQALDPVNPGRISVSQSWAFSWNWSNIQGSVPKGGLIAVTGEYRVGETWWFVYTDGLYRSTDGGKRLTKRVGRAMIVRGIDP